MGTARAMRFFQTDPVPDELVEKVLWAATRASSGNNTQGWDFVVVRDAEQRARLGEALAGFVKRVEAMPDPGNETDRRTLVGAKNLAATFAQVPVIIVVCGANIYPARPAARDVHVLRGVRRGPEPGRGGARPRPGGRVHHPARGGRAAVPRDPRHPRRPLPRRDDPAGLARRPGRPGQPQARSKRSSTTTTGRTPAAARRPGTAPGTLSRCRGVTHASLYGRPATPEGASRELSRTLLAGMTAMRAERRLWRRRCARGLAARCLQPTTGRPTSMSDTDQIFRLEGRRGCRRTPSRRADHRRARPPRGDSELKVLELAGTGTGVVSGAAAAALHGLDGVRRRSTRGHDPPPWHALAVRGDGPPALQAPLRGLDGRSTASVARGWPAPSSISATARRQAWSNGPSTTSAVVARACAGSA